MVMQHGESTGNGALNGGKWKRKAREGQGGVAKKKPTWEKQLTCRWFALRFGLQLVVVGGFETLKKSNWKKHHPQHQEKPPPPSLFVRLEEEQGRQEGDNEVEATATSVGALPCLPKRRRLCPIHCRHHRRFFVVVLCSKLLRENKKVKKTRRYIYRRDARPGDSLAPRTSECLFLWWRF
ncbi:hypothetical protein QOT17_002693 [Balamuthia mandrillaris]